MDLSIQNMFLIFIIATFFVVGAYSVFTGKMKTAPSSPSGGKDITGVKARILGFAFIGLSYFIYVLNFSS